MPTTAVRLTIVGDGDCRSPKMLRDTILSYHHHQHSFLHIPVLRRNFFFSRSLFDEISIVHQWKRMGDFENDHFSPSLSVFGVFINDASCAQFSNNGLSWMNIFHFPWYVNNACKHFCESIRLRGLYSRILFRTVVNIKVRLYNSQNIPSRGK